MPSLISADEIAFFTGQLGNHFDTFKQDIIINKEPLKSVRNTEANQYFGYGETTSITDYDYQLVSGIYPAIVSYNRGVTQTRESLIKTKTFIPENSIQIKVQVDAKNYIQNGKTENIIVDGVAYNVISEPIIQNYLGLYFYIYNLKITQ